MFFFKKKLPPLGVNNQVKYKGQRTLGCCWPIGVKFFMALEKIPNTISLSSVTYIQVQPHKGHIWLQWLSQTAITQDQTCFLSLSAMTEVEGWCKKIQWARKKPPSNSSHSSSDLYGRNVEMTLERHK